MRTFIDKHTHLAVFAVRSLASRRIIRKYIYTSIRLTNEFNVDSTLVYISEFIAWESFTVELFTLLGSFKIVADQKKKEITLLPSNVISGNEILDHSFLKKCIIKNSYPIAKQVSNNYLRVWTMHRHCRFFVINEF